MTEPGAEVSARWLQRVYAGDVTGAAAAAAPHEAAAMLADHPALVGDDPLLACAVGDDSVLQRAIASDPGWVNRPGGPLQLPPLVALTHSSLLQLPPFRGRLLHLGFLADFFFVAACFADVFVAA